MYVYSLNFLVTARVLTSHPTNFSLHDILNGLKLISFCIQTVVEIFSLDSCSCLQINSLLLTLCKFIYDYADVVYILFLV